MIGFFAIFLTISFFKAPFEDKPKNTSAPSITSGICLPEESGSLNCIREHKTSVTLSLPMKSFGADFQRNSTPSSSALRTSLAEPGIFSLSLL